MNEEGNSEDSEMKATWLIFTAHGQELTVEKKFEGKEQEKQVIWLDSRRRYKKTLENKRKNWD